MAVEPASPAIAEEYAAAVRAECLEPLWLIAEDVNSHEPRSEIRPHRWRWKTVRQRMLEAGDLVPLGYDGAARRVLGMRNPGLPRGVGTTQTLAAAFQLVHAGEEAPPHRHTAAAIRFIIEGRGTWTTVDGEPCSMEPGDLILTPNWTWHGHVNAGDGPMLWLDALDVPLVMGLNQMFFEEQRPETAPRLKGRDESLRRYGAALLPTWEHPSTAYSPLLSYKWTATEQRLQALADDPGSPYDGIALAYTNPFTGGSVMPTIACWIQMLRPGERTRAHRHTSSAVYHVVRGEGATIIDGERFTWEPGDVIVLPSWRWHSHENTGREPAVLFSVNDQPTLRALDLFREEHEPADR